MRIIHERGRRAGFSLIELLLVLVILATLTAIILPRFTGRSEQANETAAQTDIRTLESLLMNFETDCGRFPTQEEGLEALIEQPPDMQRWRGPYLTQNKVPNDPWGGDYIYVYPGRENTHGFDLSSPGPNGEPGDEDDIVNWARD